MKIRIIKMRDRRNLKFNNHLVLNGSVKLGMIGHPSIENDNYVFIPEDGFFSALQGVEFNTLHHAKKFVKEYIELKMKDKNQVEFEVGKTISINNRSFEITSIEKLPSGHTELSGTYQGDPSFLKGKRSVIADILVKKDDEYEYEW